jgi:hypothetical protein
MGGRDPAAARGGRDAAPDDMAARSRAGKSRGSTEPREAHVCLRMLEVARNTTRQCIVNITRRAARNINQHSASKPACISAAIVVHSRARPMPAPRSVSRPLVARCGASSPRLCGPRVGPTHTLRGIGRDVASASSSGATDRPVRNRNQPTTFSHPIRFIAFTEFQIAYKQFVSTLLLIFVRPYATNSARCVAFAFLTVQVETSKIVSRTIFAAALLRAELSLCRVRTTTYLSACATCTPLRCFQTATRPHSHSCSNTIATKNRRLAQLRL